MNIEIDNFGMELENLIERFKTFINKDDYRQIFETYAYKMEQSMSLEEKLEASKKKEECIQGIANVIAQKIYGKVWEKWIKEDEEAEIRMARNNV